MARSQGVGLVLQVFATLVITVAAASSANADKRCFSLANSYYQQVYCELDARGKAHGLPTFFDFSQNNETTQALLLKRPARSAGIELAMPAAAATPQATKAIKPVEQMSAGLRGCEYRGDTIDCPGYRYALVGNRANSRLADDALSASNQLRLAHYRGSLDDVAAVERYLLQAYEQYLDKMLTIGLGAATLSWGKFYYLFMDLNAKGVSFSDRFEVMYHYLKMDKSAMAVSEKVSLPANGELSDCIDLGQDIVACGGGKNAVYLRQ